MDRIALGLNNQHTGDWLPLSLSLKHSRCDYRIIRVWRLLYRGFFPYLLLRSLKTPDVCATGPSTYVVWVKNCTGGFSNMETGGVFVQGRGNGIHPSIRVRQIRTYLGIGRRCALLCGDVASTVLVTVVLVAMGWRWLDRGETEWWWSWWWRWLWWCSWWCSGRSGWQPPTGGWSLLLVSTDTVDSLELTLCSPKIK